jgi:hypothetical protein
VAGNRRDFLGRTPGFHKAHRRRLSQAVTGAEEAEQVGWTICENARK